MSVSKGQPRSAVLTIGIDRVGLRPPTTGAMTVWRSANRPSVDGVRSLVDASEAVPSVV